jgi:hypothetical protein
MSSIRLYYSEILNCVFRYKLQRDGEDDIELYDIKNRYYCQYLISNIVYENLIINKQVNTKIAKRSGSYWYFHNVF